MSDRKKVRFQQPKESEKVVVLTQPKLIRSNTWIEHVKETALQNNITFKQALSKAKETYKKD